MATITEDFEIELNNGKIVDITLTILGVYDSEYGSDIDNNRGLGNWFVEEHYYSTSESLTKLEIDDLEKKIEELVESTDWDFDSVENEELNLVDY